ncbi:MAG TPA: chromosomal replication initiator protein DnaA [Firmicutes bacterium]|jgi:chromosomal replication initiator protein|nr:chromosomal replication initiator protein DnaA [Bacillota bacterium]
MSQHEQLELIWQEVLNIMASELAKPSFDAWIKDSRPVHFEGNVLFVELPNEFTRDWVDARYAAPLRKTLRHVVNKEWDLKLVIPSGVKPVTDAAKPQAPQDAEPTTESPSQAPSSSESPNQEQISSVLNPRYTFDTFVVGNSNRFAHAASLAVAEAPAKAYNPLFLYGGVGLGKTHLMHAIGHLALQRDPSINVVYVTSETFTNDLITAIGKKSMVEFRNKYRNVDVLLIDDIQFVAGKESTQEEFFHTFNALYEANRQLVISSDRPPKEIPTLEERLRSRFEWGLITDIQPPDLETRIAILKKKADMENYRVDPEVLGYIATHIQSNIRELEGAFIRVVAYANLNNRPVDIETATDALKDLIHPPKNRPITIDLIQTVVANHYGIKVTEMKSKKRTKNIAFPRQVAMFLARELTDSSLPQVGAEFGGRDHTTVIHACEKIQTAMKMDPALQMTIRELIDAIHQSS